MGGYYHASLAFQPTPPYDFVCIVFFYLDVFCCSVFMEIKLNLNFYMCNNFLHPRYDILHDNGTMVKQKRVYWS